MRAVPMCVVPMCIVLMCAVLWIVPKKKKKKKVRQAFFFFFKSARQVAGIIFSSLYIYIYIWIYVSLANSIELKVNNLHFWFLISLKEINTG